MNLWIIILMYPIWIPYIFTLVSPISSQELETDLLNLDRQLRPLMIKFITKGKKFRPEMANFQKHAFQTIRKYMNETIEDEIQRRSIQIYQYMNWGHLDENYIYQIDIIHKNGQKLLMPLQENFHAEASSQCISEINHDMILQLYWKHWSQNVSPKAIKLIDELIGIMRRAASDVNQNYNLRINRVSTIWKYIFGYKHHFSVNNLKRIWEHELRQPYLKLMLYMRRNLSDLFTIYSGIEYENYQMPAYIYDMIFNSYTTFAYSDDHIPLIAEPTMDRLKNLYRAVFKPNHFQNWTAKTLTIEAQKYYESLGFDELDEYFWRNSKFTTLPNEIVYKTRNVKYHYDGDNKLWIDILAPIDRTSFKSVHEVMFQIHRIRLVEQKNYPAILWLPDYDAFQEALTQAVISCLKTESEWTRAHEMEHLKLTAVNDFTTIASSLAINTWELDILDNNISSKNKVWDLWNKRFFYENVVPITVQNESFDIHNLLDFFIKHSLLFGKKTFNFHAVMVLILKYQILAHLCELAGQYNFEKPLQYPLHKCNLRGNRIIGDLLKRILGYGGLKTWRELLNMITKKRNTPLSTRGLLGYYAPLFEEIKKS